VPRPGDAVVPRSALCGRGFKARGRAVVPGLAGLALGRLDPVELVAVGAGGARRRGRGSGLAVVACRAVRVRVRGAGARAVKASATRQAAGLGRERAVGPSGARDWRPRAGRGVVARQRGLLGGRLRPAGAVVARGAIPARCGITGAGAVLAERAGDAVRLGPRPGGAVVGPGWAVGGPSRAKLAVAALRADRASRAVARRGGRGPRDAVEARVAQPVRELQAGLRADVPGEAGAAVRRGDLAHGGAEGAHGAELGLARPRRAEATRWALEGAEGGARAEGSSGADLAARLGSLVLVLAGGARRLVRGPRSSRAGVPELAIVGGHHAL
jgi:hypothetical protein